jgi:hypothetical protein
MSDDNVVRFNVPPVEPVPMSEIANAPSPGAPEDYRHIRAEPLSKDVIHTILADTIPLSVADGERAATVMWKLFVRELLERENKIEWLNKTYAATAHEVEQTLARALGYPRYDPVNFPPRDDVDPDLRVTGDHVPETLAAEAAKRIDYLTDDAASWRKQSEDTHTRALNAEAKLAMALKVVDAARQWAALPPMAGNSFLERAERALYEAVGTFDENMNA